MLRTFIIFSIVFAIFGSLFFVGGCSKKESSARVDSSVTKMSEAPVTEVTNNTTVTESAGNSTKAVSDPTVTHTENIAKNTVTEKTVMPEASDASAKCISNIEQLGNACKKYAGMHGGEYPESLSSLTEKSSGVVTLLEDLPTCPLDDSDYKYIRSDDKKSFGIWCDHDHSADITKPMPAGYPQFDSATGLMTPTDAAAAQTARITLPKETDKE